MAGAIVNEHVRYEPEENPPPLIALGAGAQAAMLIVAPVVLTVVIVVRIAEASESYLAWAIFAAMAVCGATTVLQAARWGRFGSGHILIMGTSGAFIAVCVAALTLAGPSTLASLVVISSLFQFVLAARLSLLRRIFTPTVTGTVIMLIAVTVAPVIYDSVGSVPDGTDASAAPLVAAVTLAVMVAMVLRARPSLRLWSPIAGIVAGCAVGAPYGLYDTAAVADAAWFGVPFQDWPGIDVTPGSEFWALLPAFIVVTLVGAIETIGDGVAIQRISRRHPRATDFRVVQGALNADGMGNLLSGVGATLPNTTYSTSISLAEVTGIGARRVGIIIGAIIFGLAFFPKFAALLIAIPLPVAAAYLLVLISLLFVQGMKIVIENGVDYRKAAVAGLAFWIGVGFQNGWVFADQLGDGFLGTLLGNGMTSGAIVAVVMMVFLELTGPRRKRLRIDMDEETLPKLGGFLRKFAKDAGWTDASAERLVLVGEETLHSMTAEDDDPELASGRHLVVTARSVGSGAELEFVSAADEENLEDRLAYMGENPDISDGRDISFHLLRRLSSSVNHQKYHGVDIVSVNVANT